MLNKNLLILLIALITVSLNYVFLHTGKENTLGVETGLLDTKTVRGLILPHHSIAAPLIDQSWNRILANNSYSNIVILGPNHFLPEQNKILIADNLNNSKVNFGIVSKFVSIFPNSKNNSNLVMRDHAINTHLPYINKYYPNSLVVPVLFSNNISIEELKEIATFFSSNLPEDTLFLASVDFSHDSSLLEGLQKNDESVEVLSKFDYAKIKTFSNDHIDSPSSIITLLKIMENKKSKNWQTWYSSHSAIILKDIRLSGTSYVIGKFN